MTSMEKIRREALIGVVFLVLCFAFTVLAAWMHSVIRMVIPSIGIFACALGLWCNGSRNGMQFFEDLGKDKQ